MKARWGLVIILGCVSNLGLADQAGDSAQSGHMPMQSMVRGPGVELFIARNEYTEEMAQIQREDASNSDEDRAYETIVTIPKKGATLATRAPAGVLPNFGGIVKDMRVLLIPKKNN